MLAFPMRSGRARPSTLFTSTLLFLLLICSIQGSWAQTATATPPATTSASTTPSSNVGLVSTTGTAPVTNTTPVTSPVNATAPDATVPDAVAPDGSATPSANAAVDATPPVNSAANAAAPDATAPDATAPVNAAANAAPPANANGPVNPSTILTGTPLWKGFSATLELANPAFANLTTATDALPANGTEVTPHKGPFPVPFPGTPSRYNQDGVYRLRTINHQGSFALAKAARLTYSSQLQAETTCDGPSLFAIRNHPDGIHFQISDFMDSSHCLAPSSDTTVSNQYNASGITGVAMDMKSTCDLSATPPEVRPGSGLIWWKYSTIQTNHQFAHTIVLALPEGGNADKTCLQGSIYNGDDWDKRSVELRKCAQDTGQLWFFEPAPWCSSQFVLNLNMERPNVESAV